MGENLPLIPGKSAVFSDVTPVLREVFREMDQLPPLALEKTSATDDEKLWIEKHNLECEDIWQKEGDVKKQFAKRKSKKQPQNVYGLSKPSTEMEKEGRGDKELIERKHLMQRVQHNAAGDQALWIQNTLNKSSCDVITDSVIGYPSIQPEELLRDVEVDKCSRQTYSVGELQMEIHRPPARKHRSPPVPQYIRCIPQEINFINFKIGQTYSQNIRIFNVSKSEIRVSLSLPRRRELEVELSGPRGLRITASSITDLKVVFRPSDTRDIKDELHIRTSLGRGQVVPIKCFMVPPELHIFIQKLHSNHCSSSKDLDIPIKEGNIVDLGARLLGDEHRVGLVLRCDAAHASFFMLTEDAWLDLTVEEFTSKGNIKTGDFTLYPSWWTGGGITKGLACCRATTTGFHKADLRILSSTAVTRTLHVVADSVYYAPGHVTVEIPEKNRIVTCDSDPKTKHTVNLGVAFPNRLLSTTLKINNNSPIPYSFYWKFRPWDTCSCWQDCQDSVTSFELGEETEVNLCPGAKLAKRDKKKDVDDDIVGIVCRVHLHPHWGEVLERSSTVVSVRVPQVGARLGTHRVILMLIVKNIPIESFPPKCTPNIVSTRTVDEIGIDGRTWTREVCEIVQEQLEITWEVVPVRFIILPPVVPLIYSRRIKSVDMTFRAVQLFGNEEIPASWNKSAPLVLPSKLLLSPTNSVIATLTIPLFSLPNECPDSDVIKLKADTDEWKATCLVTRSCATRHPAVRPSRVWLGVVPPGAKVSGKLTVVNDTHQDISWLATPYPWTGETPIKPCVQATIPCTMCYENDCVCSLLTPSRGALARGEQAIISYNVRAQIKDGCVTSLIKISRADSKTQLEGGPATDARVSLVAYRVLAPRLVLRVFPCGGDKKGGCNNCDLDACENASGGSALLRPSQALVSGICSCYRLKITNITPTATVVCWEAAIEGEEFLKVKFIPNIIYLGSYSEKVISVILEPRNVCERRLFVLRAQVEHAYTPLYLVIDAAIEGVQIVCEVAFCGADGNCTFMRIPKIQKELTSTSDEMRLTTPMDWFHHDDRERKKVPTYCTCDESSDTPTPMSPPKPSSSGTVCKENSHSLQESTSSPQIPEQDSEPSEEAVVPEEHCLQFRNLPLRTVRSHRLKLFNVGRVTARWRTIVRRWPRYKSRVATVEQALASDTERWAADVSWPGVGIQCLPNKGVLAVGQSIEILVQVYADCWGAYFDQIMVMVDGVDPIILDVWIEAVGSPLQFAKPSSCNESEYDSTMWLSRSDPERTLRVKNISRSKLTVCAYTLLEHEHSQDAFPFRLYMRLADVIPCKCSDDTLSSSENTSRHSFNSNSDYLKPEPIGVEYYLNDDYGYQNEEYYRIEPRVCTVAPGDWMEWRVILNSTTTEEPIPPGVVILQIIPNENIKKCHYWRRCEPPPARIGVRAVPRAPLLRLSCSEVVARLCALDLDYQEVSRIRKRFRVRNIGNAPLRVWCVTSLPWQIVTDKPRHNHHCQRCYFCVEYLGKRCDEIEMLLEPWSSTAVCVEVVINTEEVWPTKEDIKDSMLPTYPPIRYVTGDLKFVTEQELLKTLPLTLEVQLPRVFLEPAVIDFGLVTYGDKRKTYMTAWHSSLTAYVDLAVSYKGNGKIRLYPRHINVAPGKRERVYIQYTAKLDCPEPIEGQVRFVAAAGANDWCRAELTVRAVPTRDGQYHLPAHDYMDQWHLLPFKIE